MQSFCTALPYSNRVIAEKAAISHAQQAKLDAKYGVIAIPCRSLEDLSEPYLD